MELSEEEKNEKKEKKCVHCLRKTFLTYEYENTCISCGYNVKKRQKKSQVSTKEINFIVRRKNAQQTIFAFA